MRLPFSCLSTADPGQDNVIGNPRGDNMTRKIWATVAVIIAAVLALAGFAGMGDYYDTRHPIYAFVGHFVPKDQHDRAEAYAAAMQRQDLTTLKAMSEPAMMSPDFYAAVPRIAAYIPAGRPISTGPIEYSVTANTNGQRTAVLMINHVYPNGGVVFTTTVFNQLDGKVVGFNVRALTPADVKSVRFNPLAANPTQAAVLIVALLLIAFTLATLYRCLSLPGVRFKWLWFIFITAGIGSLRFNWMTQTVDFSLLDIHWGAGGVYQQLFMPATIYLNAPVGAVVFWLFGRRTAGASKRTA